MRNVPEGGLPFIPSRSTCPLTGRCEMSSFSQGLFNFSRMFTPVLTALTYRLAEKFEPTFLSGDFSAVMSFTIDVDPVADVGF